MADSSVGSPEHTATLRQATHLFRHHRAEAQAAVRAEDIAVERPTVHCVSASPAHGHMAAPYQDTAAVYWHMAASHQHMAAAY